VIFGRKVKQWAQQSMGDGSGTHVVIFFRKLLALEESRQSICEKYGIHFRILQKILERSESACNLVRNQLL